jgi:hypothetical protein
MDTKESAAVADPMTAADEYQRVLRLHRLHASINICHGCEWRPVDRAGSLQEQHRAHVAQAIAADPGVRAAVERDGGESVPDGSVLAIPSGYIKDADTGLNVGTDPIQVLVRYDPGLPTLGQTSSAPFGPSTVITLREWSEQVFLHELLHVATRPYYEGGYYQAADDPDGHQLVNRIEVALWEAGFRRSGRAVEREARAEGIKHAAHYFRDLSTEQIDRHEVIRLLDYLAQQALPTPYRQEPSDG